MIGAPSASRIWIVAGATDLRRGFDGLCAQVQHQLNESPYSGDLYIFRGRRGDKIKVLWYSGDGALLQAIKQRDLHVAAGQGGHGVALFGATVDVAGGDRLAQTQAERSRAFGSGSHPADAHVKS